MTLAQASTQSPPFGRLKSATVGTSRIGAVILLCLTPLTAVVALGWLTRESARGVAVRLAGSRSIAQPRLVLGDAGLSRSLPYRLLGGLAANLLAGIRAWAGTLAFTLPFSLIAMVGWLTGWENSFNKGYEFAGLWPLVSIASALVSLPVLSILPMAIAHQAASGRFRSIFEVRRIAGLVPLAGWRYLALTVLIAIGSIGALGARVLPTFAEQIWPAVTSGYPDAASTFAGRFRLLTTSLLVVGLLVVRRTMAWCYAHAVTQSETGRRSSILKSGLILFLCSAAWLGLVFLVYVAQFLNYFWWNWFNQPILMLPWLG